MLQFITHNPSSEEYATELKQIKCALDGGCRWIQLRKKNASRSVLMSAALEARRLCDIYGDVVLIVDDDISVAVESGADGVHLGKNDMPVDRAKAIAPEGFLIGATANTFDDILSAHRLGADYIGLGPLRYTTTKQNLSPLIGLEGYAGIMARMADCGIRLPVVAIGSVSIDDVAPLLERGLAGVAVSGAIIAADDPVSATRRFMDIINDHKRHNNTCKTIWNN